MVFARTGKAFVLLHQYETNLRVLLAIDSSGSMGYGRRGGTKLEYAQFLTTALSHVIAGAQDHIGLAVLADKLHDYLPPGGTPMHVARVQEAIEALEPTTAPQMGQTLRELFTISPRRGVLVAVSDYLMDDLEEVATAWRLFRHRNWDVVVLHLVHPEEERLPLGTALRFLDMEGEGRIDCSPSELAAAYEQKFAAHVASVRQLALVCGCDYRFVSTGVPYLQTLQTFLVERAG
jgi:uncharacterized protein (DUF58 family)